VTFVPSFFWIFLGAPYAERVRGNRRLASALAGITAAVVGVILNLAVWFALHTLFGRVSEGHVGPLRIFLPKLETLEPAALVLSLFAFVALLRLRWGMLPTLGVCCLLGVVYTLAF
jgi:chromate transporter